MSERRQYSGASQQEAIRKYESDRAAMEVAGFQPGPSDWTKESRRLRPDVHTLTVEWLPEEPWTGVRFYETGEVRVQASTPDEVRSAIQDLKARKKEMALEKKELTTATKTIRAEHRVKAASRGGLHRGSGGVNRTVRDMQRAGRERENAQTAERVAAIERAKIALDRQATEIDRLIVKLEGHVGKR